MFLNQNLNNYGFKGQLVKGVSNDPNNCEARVAETNQNMNKIQEFVNFTTERDFRDLDTVTLKYNELKSNLSQVQSFYKDCGLNAASAIIPLLDKKLDDAYLQYVKMFMKLYVEFLLSQKRNTCKVLNDQINPIIDIVNKYYPQYGTYLSSDLQIEYTKAAEFYRQLSSSCNY